MKRLRPQYWKLRLVASDRFACFYDADFDSVEYNGEREFILTKETAMQLALRIAAVQKAAGLPVPAMEAVPFDKNGDCIKEMIFRLKDVK